MAQWHVHAHSGQRYGPVEREELDRWVEEGRLTVRCQVWMDGWPEWRLASEIFPQINAQGSPGATAQQPGTPQPGAATQQGSPFAGGQNPVYLQPDQGAYGDNSAYGSGAPLLPDRGATVFVLGLLSFIFVCIALSIPAWIMGGSDLKEIEAGRRDPSGRGMTMAGMVLGIVSLVISILVYILTFLWMVENIDL